MSWCLKKTPRCVCSWVMSKGQFARSDAASGQPKKRSRWPSCCSALSGRQQCLSAVLSVARRLYTLAIIQLNDFMRSGRWPCSVYIPVRGYVDGCMSESSLTERVGHVCSLPPTSRLLRAVRWAEWLGERVSEQVLYRSHLLRRHVRPTLSLSHAVNIVTTQPTYHPRAPRKRLLSELKQYFVNPVQSALHKSNCLI